MYLGRQMPHDTTTGRTKGGPLLRWAGSKRKLIPQLCQRVPENAQRYIEPFAGSACLFFHLLPKSAVLGDANPELIKTYRVVRDQPIELAEALARMPRTEQFYYDLRARAPRELDRVERAARFVYLNRFCFNGVYRTNRQGQFNVPRGVRTGAVPTADNIKSASSALRRAKLIAGDFESCLESIEPGDFVYLDPPYAKRGRPGYGEYGYDVFCEDDLERLIKSLQSIDSRGGTFLLSYSYSLRTRELFRDWHCRTLLVRRHVAGFGRHRGLVREVLVTNATDAGREHPPQ